MHLKTVSYILAGLLLAGCGSKLDKAKKAYTQGEYYKAEQILEAMMLTEPTAEVEMYLNICKAVFDFQTTDSLVNTNSIAAAWAAFNHGGKYDTRSGLFVRVGKNLAKATIREVESKEERSRGARGESMSATR